MLSYTVSRVFPYCDFSFFSVRLLCLHYVNNICALFSIRRNWFSFKLVADACTKGDGDVTLLCIQSVLYCKCHSLFSRNVPFYLLIWGLCLRARARVCVCIFGIPHHRFVRCNESIGFIGSTAALSCWHLVKNTEQRVSAPTTNVSRPSNDDSNVVACDSRFNHFIYRNHTVARSPSSTIVIAILSSRASSPTFAYIVRWSALDMMKHAFSFEFNYNLFLFYSCFMRHSSILSTIIVDLNALCLDASMCEIRNSVYKRCA